jgi:uncharacterized membrane protein (DUF485 family)
MQQPANEPIASNPKFQELVRQRSRFAWALSGVMLFLYLGFILLVAFGKQFLAQRIGDGVTTIGIPIGLGIIVSAFALTGIYVWVANSRFDKMTSDLIKDITR